MPNILISPLSSAIFFDRNVAGSSTVAALNSAVRLNYDQGGGLNITSFATAASALDRFTVDGTQGRLFSVTDVLTGSIFSVNDISGLPILEVLDTNTVIAGTVNTNAFIVSGTRIGMGRAVTSTDRLAVSGNMTVIGAVSATLPLRFPATATAPANTSSVAAWLDVFANDTLYKLPLYQ